MRVFVFLTFLHFRAGWIQSPGHRKNLLANSVWCGIGVYRNSEGAFYLTHLFAS